MKAEWHDHTDIGGSSWPLLFWPWLVEETSSQIVAHILANMGDVTAYRGCFTMTILSTLDLSFQFSFHHRPLLC